jgi:hypothetical protein
LKGQKAGFHLAKLKLSLGIRIDCFRLKDKQLAGLGLSLRRFPQAQRALVITRTAQGIVPYHDIELQAVPLWRFLLDAGRYL